MRSKKKISRSLREEIILTQNSLSDKKALVDLELRCLRIEKSYEELRNKLVKLLSKEQIDAAKTCGVTPEVYALEWIEIYKDKWREQIPAYATNVDALYRMK
jgi:hypothetical protein